MLGEVVRTGKDHFKATRHLRAALLTSSALVLAWALPAATSRAASNGTWLASPGSNDYGTSSNWDGGFVPPGTASFGASNTTSLVISSASVGGWTFNAGASNYTFDVSNSLNFTGVGITVNGGSATITNTGSGSLSFYNTSTAGNATINNSGELLFFGSSTAGNATITNNADLQFLDNSTAGNATINNNNIGNILTFFNSSSAGSATITNSYVLKFRDNSTAGGAAIVNNGGGSVDFSPTTGLNGDNKISAGSIAGAGSYDLGANELTVGSNNASTEVSGGISGAGGSLVKVGTGTLTLSGTNSYTGGTTVNGGTLQLGSAGGVGSIVGTVNVGASGTFSVFNGDTSGITSIVNSGTTNFYNTSSASAANITNAGTLRFNDDSTAGGATITNNGSGIFVLYGNATASTATITNNAYMYFYNSSTAGNAAITNNNWLSFNENSTADHATLTNNSSLYFYNTSTAGSATIANASLLVFRDSSTAGSASITNSGTINFVVSSTAGSAVITNNAGGTTSFQDQSTAGNARLINNAANAVFDFSGSSGPNGDHKLSAGSIAGNGTFFLGANELTVGGNNLSTTVSGVIADGGASGGTGGSLVKTGTGTLTLSGANTYSGGTTFAGGTVSVSSDANLGDLTGSLTFTGGTLQVTGTAFNTTARTVTLGAGGGTFDIANAANDFVVSQSISGSTLTKVGAGTLTLTGAAAFSGATVSAGTLAFLNSTAGSAVITNNAQLAFYGNSSAGSATIINSGNALFDGNSTAGNAQLINASPSAVVNFWTPGPGSDGRISAGSIAGSGRFDLNSAELTVGGNNLSTVVTGVLTGDGNITGTSLIKAGTGTMTLSGINTYTGATVVDGGTLAVNGSIASSSSLTVNGGATLGGTGIVGHTTIASGGTLAPGNSIGTLTVSGNLGFTAGSFYRVEVSATAADRTNVSGIATLSGATVQAVAIPGRFRGQTYTILNATGGLGGTQFAGLSVSGSFSPARNPHLTYDLNNVYLVLDPGTIVLPAGTGANQSNVAGAINGAVASGGTPPAGFDALLNMGQPQLNQGLSQVSGQPGAAGTQAAFNAMQQFVGMLDPFGGSSDGYRGGTGGDGGALGYASTAPNEARVREAYAAVTPRETSGETIDRRWGVWASGYGGGSNLSGNAAAGSSTTTSRIYGTVVGADYRVSPNTLIGFALGGAGYNFALSDSLGGGRADLFQAGLYGRYTFGPAYISAALAYGWQDVTTDRTVTVAGTDKLTANFKASTFSGRLETGWRFAPIPASSFGVTPYAAAQVTTFRLPGYGETALVGSNQFALSYSAQDTTNVRTELGARTDRRFLVDDGALTLRGRLAWAHDTNTNRLVSAAFQTLPGAAFTVNGAQPAADSALVGGRAEMKWKNGLSLAGTVEGEFSRSSQTYTGKGVVRYEW